MFFTALLFCISFNSYSTHIVGGELNYKCLGGNQYEIKLRVYRDCYNGVPPFDNPAAVGIFDVNNVLVTTVYLNFPGSTTLPPTVAQADACVQPGVGVNVCTEVAEYVGTVVLPPRAGGYQLAYQRCCRNPTISNIVNPGSQGATYYAKIPDQSVACNSSPLFTFFPSIFVCVNNPIIFDHSATDADGDSIVYSLCAPYTGATSGSSQPQPPNPPPYTSVTWKAPYNASNLLGGVPLTIDPKTGLMTGTPNTIGQFIVGVCADEYRNGVLINTTKRDFQFNVINCRPDVVAAAGSFVSDCNNHTVTFINNTTGNATYFWNFGDPAVTTDTSSLKNPTYTYPALGTYTVTLIAFSIRGPTCNDTLKTMIVTVDTCKPCAMTLGITKVDGTCSGSGGGCTATPNTLAQWNSNTPPSPNPCPGTGINIWYQGVPDPIGTSPSNTYYLCGATYYTITSAQWTFKTEPPGNICPGTGSFVTTRDPGKQFYYVCPCTGGTTGNLGSATVTPASGTPTYTYSWSTSPAQTTANITGLSAGTYSVTVTDAAGCVKTASVIVDANSTIVLTPSQTLPTSCVAADGTASVSVSGGAAPYTYSWSNGGTTSSISGLSPGLYTVNVIDNLGCNKSITISITQPVVINVSSSKTNAKCNGNNGTGTVIPSGGSGTYSYVWSTSPVQTGITASNLQAGYYVVTVTDAGGCTNTSSVTIIDSSLTLTSSFTTVSCNGNSNGTATITATNGTPGYTYSWNTSPVQTTVTATGLSAGTYIGTVTDLAGCTGSVTVIVSEPSPLLAEPKNTSTISCAGVANGSAHADVSGGTSAFTYLWNNGQTTQTISGLSAGTYTVTVTDSKGCTASNTVNITAPPVLSITAISSDASCNGSNTGAATVSPLGGSPNYTYSWSTSPVQTTQTATNLSAGTYTVTVTDANGCTSSLTNIVISEPVAITLSTSSVPVVCSPGNGSVSVTATGGIGSINYLWSPSGQTTQTATNLSAGTYTVTVTDSNGCTNTSTAVVPNTITASISGTTTICLGGSSTLTASGGGTYVWSANAGSATTASVTVSPVSTTTYTVTVTVGTCSATATQMVTVNPAIIAGISGTTTICPGGSTILTGTGGGTYSWNTGATTTAITVSPGATTTYTVTVTSGGCSTSATQVVTVNSLPAATISGTGLICVGDNTTLTAGGGGTYSWDNGATTTSIIVSPASTTTYTVTVTSGGCSANATQVVTVATPVATISGSGSVCVGNSTVLTAGGGGTYSWDTGATTTSITVSPVTTTTYTVTVTVGSCTATATQVVNVNSLPSATISGTGQICVGNSTVLTAGGGGTYSWNTGATTTSITISPASTTTYTVTVTSGGCSANATQVVTVNSLPVATISGTSLICVGDNTTLTAGGGVTYSWDSGATTTSITISPATTTTYTVTVTSAIGCSANATQIVTVAIPTATISGTNIICLGNSTTLTASGGGTYTWDNGATTTSITVSPVTTTTYTVTVTVGTCTATATQEVTVNPAIVVTISGTSTICSGSSTTLTASGGGTYTWNTGATTTAITISPSSTATYTVIVDNGICTATATQSVVVNPVPVAVISGAITVCSGNSTVLTASGGGTYLWSANAGSATTAAVTVTPGSYTVTVTLGSCSASTTATVTQTNITLTSSKTNVSCNGNNDGMAIVNPSGGTPLYTYSWNTSPVQTDSIAIGLSAGIYTVLVTDANGCSKTAQVTINGKVNNVNANFSVNYKVTCDEGVEAMFTDSSSIADSWLWDFGDGTTSQLQNPTHVYSYGTIATVTLIAKDGGCSDTASLVVSTNSLNEYIDLYTPNVFTPNDDGTNDCFLVSVGNGLEKCIQIKIFDRWGLMIFESERGSCWDGTTTSGKSVSAGTYFYIINISDIVVRGSLSIYR